MHADSVADPRPFRSVLVVAVVVLLALLLTAGLSSWRDLAAARERERELGARIEESQRGIETLQRRVSLLQEDPEALERLAREELWMARPDEVIIVLPEAILPAPTPPSTSPPSTPDLLHPELPDPEPAAPPFARDDEGG